MISQKPVLTCQAPEGLDEALTKTKPPPTLDALHHSAVLHIV